MNQSTTPIASPFVLAILEGLIGLIPSLATWIEKGIEDDDSPLADQVRNILPVEGASAVARRKLEEGSL